MFRTFSNGAINNDIYSTDADGWWHENHFLHLLKTGINPARFAYFHHVLTDRLSVQTQNLHVLDIGCGGGILSEEFARLGCRVTGIDPSAATLLVARRHAAQQGLGIDYVPGRAERLPFQAAKFDLVVCCDVLEHVEDLPATISEVGRVIKPGGVFFYDTINRTPQSRINNILAAQQFPLTSFFPPNTHLWQKFIKPEELLDLFAQAGMENRHMTGLNSALPIWQVAGFLIARKLGWLTFAELGQRLQFQTGGGLDTSYIGWALRSGLPPLSFPQ